MNTDSWSRTVAALALDALVDHGLLKREDFDAALEIAAEEIRIRLVMGDYPPVDDVGSLSP
jgi:hypothetical protein